MSLDATKWAWSQDIKPTQKLVLLSMADRAGEKHECFPSIARLCSDTGLNRKTVMANIAQLQEQGLLKVEKTFGEVNVYMLVGVDNQSQNIHQSQKRDTSQNRDSTSPKNGTTTSPKSGTPTSPKNGTLNLPSESTNESTNESIAFDPRSYLLSKGVEASVVSDYLDVRKAKKAPLTKTAIVSIEREADKASISLNSAITECCVRSWQSFKAEWYLKGKPAMQKNEPSELCPQWCADAGFANHWEAGNKGCWQHNAHLFKNGVKIERA